MEKFVAPDSLREVGWMAFGNCKQLKSVKLNDKIEKLGDLCFWGIRVRKCKVHQEIGKIPYQLGISA